MKELMGVGIGCALAFSFCCHLGMGLGLAFLEMTTYSQDIGTDTIKLSYVVRLPRSH